VAAADSNAHLSLGRASVVVGTNVMRADLSLNRGGAGFRVVVTLKPRNILFIEPGQKAARWLLPDNDHIMSDSSDIRVAATNGNAQRMIATSGSGEINDRLSRKRVGKASPVRPFRQDNR